MPLSVPGIFPSNMFHYDVTGKMKVLELNPVLQCSLLFRTQVNISFHVVLLPALTNTYLVLSES